MRELGLESCQPRPWRYALTEQDGHAGPIPDLVNRDFTADAPGQKMVGDITYIPTWEGWGYLATVIDCDTNAVVGWAMDDNYKTPLIEAAIGMADRNHRLAEDGISALLPATGGSLGVGKAAREAVAAAPHPHALHIVPRLARSSADPVMLTALRITIQREEAHYDPRRPSR
jgi:transposase InsO family protein